MYKLVIRGIKMNEMEKKISCFMIAFMRIFIIIRSCIKSPYNISLLNEISKYCLLLEEQNVAGFEAFRLEIIRVVKDDVKTKEFLEDALRIYEIDFITDNLCEINRYLPIINNTALEICTQLKQKNFDRAYDLVDAIHCLPEAIMKKKQWNSKVFWKTYIKLYREKWDKNFLSIEEKKLVKHGILGMSK